MSDSIELDSVEWDCETLYDEPYICKPTLGERGREWRDKLINGIASRARIMVLKALGWSKDEIVEEEPGYYYDPEYHDLCASVWFRRTKSLADLSRAVGTVAGYSAWEWCGERYEDIKTLIRN